MAPAHPLQPPAHAIRFIAIDAIVRAGMRRRSTAMTCRPSPPFSVPDGMLQAWRGAAAQGRAARQAWRHRLAARPRAGQAVLRAQRRQALAAAAHRLCLSADDDRPAPAG